MTAAGIEQVNYRVLPSEQPQPPTMPGFPSFFREHVPTGFIRMKVARLQMMSSNRFVDRPQQRFDALQSIGDRSRSKAQSQETKLLDRALRRSLQVKLFQ